MARALQPACHQLQITAVWGSSCLSEHPVDSSRITCSGILQSWCSTCCCLPPPGVHTCVEVEGYNVCTVRSPHESLTMPFNWVAGPATTQSEFFKGKLQPASTPDTYLSRHGALNYGREAMPLPIHDHVNSLQVCQLQQHAKPQKRGPASFSTLRLSVLCPCCYLQWWDDQLWRTA